MTLIAHKWYFHLHTWYEIKIEQLYKISTNRLDPEFMTSLHCKDFLYDVLKMLICFTISNPECILNL